MRHETHGFTLIELLIVVMIIGILAAISIPKYASVREEAFLTSMRHDLESLSVQQEIYFNDNFTYSLTLDGLGYSPSDGIDIALTATQDGFAAVATHESIVERPCGYFTGTATAADAGPATQPDKIVCAASGS